MSGFQTMLQGILEVLQGASEASGRRGQMGSSQGSKPCTSTLLSFISLIYSTSEYGFIFLKTLYSLANLMGNEKSRVWK